MDNTFANEIIFSFRRQSYKSKLFFLIYYKVLFEAITFTFLKNFFE